MNMPRPGSSGQMTINLPGVIKTLAESLYSDPTVSVRELIQNANDTCIVRKADDPNAPDPEIHIRFDAWRRILVIEDNGAGLTEDEVKMFLTVIGSSMTDQVRTRLEEMGQGSLAERLIGRFGLGLLSAFIIGTSIEFVTLSYKQDAQPIWWECDGGQEYKMGTAEGRTTPGTTVTVSVDLKHVGLLNEDKLTELIHLYADLLSVPIYLNTKPIPINAMNAPWHSEISTEAEYREYVAKCYPNEAILDIIPVDITEDDGKFKVGGVLFVPKQPLIIVREHGDVIVYVRRMFVCKDERTILPEWAKFVKGVIESPNLRETASRESIQHDENLQRVQKVLSQVILDHLTTVSNEDPRLFREIVTNHNLVIKAWAIVSDELFERIKDIVLFTTDAGLINLQRYFEMSRHSKTAIDQERAKRYIFYFTTPGGTYSVLFAAKGLRVINAYNFPDEAFLERYAERHEDVILKRLDVGGDFIFEELSTREHKWVELEEAYARRRVDAKVVKFEPEDIPAVMIFPETEPVTDQVDKLLADPNLSPALKSLVRQMWDEREQRRKGLGSGGILYINATNPVIQKLVDLDLSNNEISDVMTVIYTNAMMLSTQGTRMILAPESSKSFFESNNRMIAALMTKIYEVLDLKAQQAVTNSKRTPTQPLLTVTGDVVPKHTHPSDSEDHSRHVEQTRYITCFVALPFKTEYDILVEALREVLEVAPYFWKVERADTRFFESTIADNVRRWIARSQCFAVDLSEGNDNVMMELGHMYWGYPERQLILLQRENIERRLADLGERIRIFYPWDNPPSQKNIVAKLREEIRKFDELKGLKGQAHYLSSRLISTWIQSGLAEALARDSETVEEFVNKDPVIISSSLGAQQISVDLIQALQKNLRDVCGIK
jgi:molecular chaperone HtpG